MKKIKIFVDTAADMSEELRKEYDIDIINFLSVFDGESFVAGEELSNEAFYKKLAESEKIPTTSQTPPAVMYETLLNASKDADSVVYFGPMGCQTGFYLLVRDNVLPEKVVEVLRDALQKTVDHTGDVFGNSEVECGNHKTLNLEKAKTACKEYLTVLNGVNQYN